ncbi:MAG: sigma-70 family RNA polymerase sigma factor [Verrucomicrobiota bacterium]|nr:sigma-70 family RNA polymerase sigma factor [Verrucomicrobiota bacterium]|tara:strand:+ start:305 stop:931 length:627 start_codon:yes stop_codon:yes gene_type:complete
MLETISQKTPAKGVVPMPEWNEKEVVKRAQKGDMEACDELIQKYQERIYSTIYHMISNHEDASDLAQITFIKAIRKINNFKGQSSFFTWLYRIAVNNTINFIRTKRKRVILSINQMDEEFDRGEELLGLVSKETPQREINRLELQGILNAAMLKLSANHRLVVTLHDVQGMPHEQIGEIMDCNTNTVRTRLHYARKQLQAYLSDYLKQ